MDPRYLTVIGACLTQFTVIGIHFSFGLFFKELQAEFGWSRTLLSGANALAFFMMGVLAMLGGRLNDRFGPKWVLGVAGLCYGAGYVLLSQANAPWQLYALFGTLIAVGMGAHDVVTLSTVARWFEARRGIMTAVTKVGTALGQMAIPPLAAVLILGFGWQTAMLALGGSAAVLLLLAALMMQLPGKEDIGGGVPQPRTGLSFAEARQTRLFWTLCAVQFLFFPSLMTLPLHLPVHASDIGMTKTQAALLLSVIGGASIAGRLAVGGLVDRIGGRNGYILCFSALIIGLVGFVTVRDVALLFVFVGVYGFGHGGFFTVVSPSIAEYFGMRAHGAMFGVVLFFGTIGGSVGPVLTGLAFDMYGSYTLAFAALLACAVAGLALVLTLPHRVTQS